MAFGKSHPTLFSLQPHDFGRVSKNTTHLPLPWWWSSGQAGPDQGPTPPFPGHTDHFRKDPWPKTGQENLFLSTVSPQLPLLKFQHHRRKRRNRQTLNGFDIPESWHPEASKTTAFSTMFLEEKINFPFVQVRSGWVYVIYKALIPKGGTKLHQE